MGTSHSYYHSKWAGSPRSLQNVARKVTKAIRESDVQFDAIACRGVSGIVVASAVASRLAKQLIVVRKPDVKSHADVTAEGRPLSDYTYIVIDDFICSGATIRETMKTLLTDEKFQSHGYGRCVGVFLYSDFVRDRNDGWFDQSVVRRWEEGVKEKIETEQREAEREAERVRRARREYRKPKGVEFSIEPLPSGANLLQPLVEKYLTPGS